MPVSSEIRGRETPPARRSRRTSEMVDSSPSGLQPDVAIKLLSQQRVYRERGVRRGVPADGAAKFLKRHEGRQVARIGRARDHVKQPCRRTTTRPLPQQRLEQFPDGADRVPLRHHAPAMPPEMSAAMHGEVGQGRNDEVWRILCRDPTLEPSCNLRHDGSALRGTDCDRSCYLVQEDARWVSHRAAYDARSTPVSAPAGSRRSKASGWASGLRRDPCIWIDLESRRWSS